MQNLIAPSYLKARKFEKIKLLEQIIVDEFGIYPIELKIPTRGRHAASMARQFAIYLAHVMLGIPLNVVATHYGRHRTTATHACHVIEDRRDDKDFDARISRIEEKYLKALGCEVNS